jgi:hypothetical protein
MEPQVGFAHEEGGPELEHVEPGLARGRRELRVDLAGDPAVVLADRHRDHDRGERHAARAGGLVRMSQRRFDPRSRRMARPHPRRVPRDVRARPEVPANPIGDEVDATQPLSQCLQPRRASGLEHRAHAEVVPLPAEPHSLEHVVVEDEVDEHEVAVELERDALDRAALLLRVDVRDAEVQHLDLVSALAQRPLELLRPRLAVLDAPPEHVRIADAPDPVRARALATLERLPAPPVRPDAGLDHALAPVPLRQHDAQRRARHERKPEPRIDARRRDLPLEPRRRRRRLRARPRDDLGRAEPDEERRSDDAAAARELPPRPHEAPHASGSESVGQNPRPARAEDRHRLDGPRFNVPRREAPRRAGPRRRPSGSAGRCRARRR